MSGRKHKKEIEWYRPIKRVEVRKTASGAHVSLLQPNKPNTHTQRVKDILNIHPNTPLSHTHTFQQPET